MSLNLNSRMLIANNLKNLKNLALMSKPIDSRLRTTPNNLIWWDTRM